MKKYFAVAAIALVSAGLVVFSRLQSQKPQTQRGVSPAKEAGLPAKTNSEGPVTVEATPVDVPEGREWAFTIILNTHAGSLDQDLTKVSTLTDGKGNSYQPLSWQGSPPGGHHREGKLIFAPITPTPKRITLSVKNVGGIAEREFFWELGGE